MKRIYCIVCICFLILQACGGLKRVEKKPQLTTTPEKLFLAVDTKADPYVIPVNYTLHIPRGYVPSCARLVYSPRLVAPGHEYLLTPLVVTGKNYDRMEIRKQTLDNKEPDYPEALEVVTHGDSIGIGLGERIPFELWMPNAKLEAKIMLEACGQQTLLYTQELAGGVFYMPVMPGPVLVKYVEKEVKKKEMESAYFYYPVNDFRIDPTLYNNQQQLDSMLSLMHRVLTDTSARVSRIVITGMCSPEGTLAYNEELARLRAGFVRNYLIRYEDISPDLVETKFVTEDWEGLAGLIENSSLPNKEALLNAIHDVGNPGQREADLRKFPQFNYIKTHFFPQLRKVVYEIYYTIKEKVVEVEPE